MAKAGQEENFLTEPDYSRDLVEWFNAVFTRRIQRFDSSNPYSTYNQVSYFGIQWHMLS